MVKETLTKEQIRLKDKEKQLTEREDALKLREEALKEKERSSGGKGDAGSAVVQIPSQPTVPTPVAKREGEEAGAGPSPGLAKGPGEDRGFPLKATFDKGFRISAEDPTLFSLRLGALLQFDYRYYNYDDVDPQKDKFDIRRARLLMSGDLLRYFDYRFYYEFQGTGSRRLLDAYVRAHPSPYLSLRFGQGKEPFGLEQYTLDEDGFFAERSMSFYLTPPRDVGIMAYGRAWNDKVRYWLGIFNGDGEDDSTSGEVDDPEITGRLTLEPFKDLGVPLIRGIHMGGSFSYARIGRNNVDIQVKTAGLTPFFTVSSQAKFNIIREAGTRNRSGLEFGWFYGPLILVGEYVHNLYTDVKTSSDQFDIPLSSYYGAVEWMITGEKPVIKNGVIQPIRPLGSIGQGGWGGLGLALRYDVFEADKSVYDDLVYVGDSVREAKAWTLALNWYLNPYLRAVLDGTRTRFDQPLKIYRDSMTGVSLYSDYEDVVTARLQLRF